MAFRDGGNLLAAGGADGYAAVYGIGSRGDDEDEEREALLSWRAHKGWIGDLQFLSLQDAAKNMMITAGMAEIPNPQQIALETTEPEHVYQAILVVTF
jgi:hypothetical protein